MRTWFCPEVNRAQKRGRGGNFREALAATTEFKMDTLGYPGTRYRVLKCTVNTNITKCTKYGI